MSDAPDIIGPAAIEPDAIEPDGSPAGMLAGMLGGAGGMLGGLFPGLDELLAEVNDPDRITLDDLAADLDDLATAVRLMSADVQWIKSALIEAVAGIPSRWRPELPPLPDIKPDDLDPD